MLNIFYEQTFGVEIESTGITRRKAARVIAEYFGTTARYIGGGYDAWGADTRDGRTWKCVYDSSIRATGSDETKCEVVTPILRYADMDDLQNIVRALRNAGACVNDSCGLHVHIGGNLHDACSITRLCNVMLKRQNLIYEALNVGDREYRWCQKLNGKLVSEMRKTEKSKAAFEPVWYGPLNEGGRRDPSLGYHGHYDATRYHGVNIHAWYTKGTVEFRLFNGTLHAGKIKAYVQFCLAMSTYAIGTGEFREVWNARFESTDNMTPEQKYKAMLNFLENRLCLTGKEFETCRLHMTANLKQAASLAA